jgi:hypothetical protein
MTIREITLGSGELTSGYILVIKFPQKIPVELYRITDNS